MTNINEEHASVSSSGYSNTGDSAGGSTSEQGKTAAAKQVASTAANETSQVAHTAVDASKDVAHEAKAQASNVAGQAKEQMSNVVHQARSELTTQAHQRAEQAATGLQTFADQLGALSEGRPQDAGHVGALVGDAQQRVHQYAQELQTRGPQAVIDDLAQLARKRPLVFLAGAAAAGFAAGRMARATAAAHSDSSGDGSSGTNAFSSPPTGRSADLIGGGAGTGMGGAMVTDVAEIDIIAVGGSDLGATEYGGVGGVGGAGDITYGTNPR